MWDEQHFMVWQTSFYSGIIDVQQGVTQGVIFNLIIDKLLRNLMERVEYRKSITVFYADSSLNKKSNSIVRRSRYI